jgi:glycosyltransferase involved in cell wall biosynthesis
MSERKEKIKITFLMPSAETGGSEKNILKLLRNLNSKNFQKSLLLQKKKGDLLEEISPDVLVKELGSLFSIFTIFSLIKYFREEKPDILVSIFPRLNVVNVLAKILSNSKAKIIISVRSTNSQLFKYSAYKISHKLMSQFIMPSLVKFFYKRADLIICVSQGVADDISKVIGNKANIKVIYNPVIDNSIIRLAKEPMADIGIKNKFIPIILTVGRLTKAKDYATLLKAFSIVFKSNPAYLLIVGEGEERKKIENLVEKLEISKNVLLLGLQNNPLKYIDKADVFVLSSVLEGFPNVLVEAMACGVPVVSTDCQSGPNEIIENGKSGFLVQVADEKKMANAIIKLLEDKELRKNFSEEGKKRAHYFSAEKSVKEFENVFLKIVE